MQNEVIKPPAGYKINPMYIELKTEKITLLLQKSVKKNLEKAAKKLKVSQNEIVHIALKEFFDKLVTANEIDTFISNETTAEIAPKETVTPAEDVSIKPKETDEEPRNAQELIFSLKDKGYSSEEANKIADEERRKQRKKPSKNKKAPADDVQR